MTFSPKIIILFLFVFFLEDVNGQFYDLTRYAEDSGLPARIIYQTAQDNDGFLWCGTGSGVYKFDGQNFYTFRADVKGTTGLRDNKVTAVLKGNDGRIWLGTALGLHFIKNDSIHFFSLPNTENSEASNHITNLFQDRAGSIWVSSYLGVFVIENDFEKVHHFVETNEGISNFRGKTIWQTTEAVDGQIWICSQKNINYFKIEEPFVFRHFKKIDLPDFADRNVVPFKVISIDSTQFLLATNQGVLHGEYFNDSLLTLRKFYDENGLQVAPHFVYDMIQDDTGSLWVGTWKNKFKKYRFQNKKLIELPLNIIGEIEEVGNNVKDITIDAHKNIWFSTTNGLFRISENSGIVFNFPPEHLPDCLPDFSNVTAMLEVSPEYIWVSNNQGLFRFKKSDILNRKCPSDFLFFEDKRFQNAYEIYKDSTNRFWICTQKGLSIFRLNDESEINKIHHFTEKTGLPHDWVIGIFEISKEEFYLTNYGGFVKIKIPNGDFEKANFQVYISESNRPNSLVNSFTKQVEKNQKTEEIWVGTFFGLSKIISDELSGDFENHLTRFGDSTSISNNAIKNIFSDSRGNFWIGTQTGLNLFSDSLQRFFRYGLVDGLPSEYILGIVEDSKKNLWIATTNGIAKCQFAPSDFQLKDFEYFNSKNGLPDNISNLNTLWIDENDKVFSGNNYGLSILGNEERLRENSPFNLQITEFEIIGTESSVVSRPDSSVFSYYDENSFRLRYTSLDLTAPKQNYYRHKINDGNWIETGNDSELRFYNFSPGEYQLTLDGTDSKGNWNPNPIRIKVEIKPPFWRSKIAYFLYLLLGGFLIRIFYQNRLKNQMKKVESQMKLETALMREREQLRQENAADFHDELGNKITKISLFLELADRSIHSGEKPLVWLKKIRENIEQLSGGFRDLLWVIDPQKDSLLDTFLRLKEFGEELFKNSNIEFSAIGFKQISSEVQLNAPTKKQLMMIFKEAMNNTLKYSEANECRFVFDNNGGRNSLSLIDNGKGFLIDKLEKGRGLKNMKMRAEKINSILTIDSFPGKGTKITLTEIPHMADASIDFDT